MTTMPMVRALNAGLKKAMEDDPKVLIMGEDVGALGGVFRVTEGLQSEFGDRRVLDTPLAESGIVGTAIGLAMRGYRPVCEIQFDGFIYPGFDQITSQLAKMTNRHEGALSMPVVIRVPYGGHIGAVEHHQESPETLFAHTAGLRVVSPSTPNDGRCTTCRVEFIAGEPERMTQAEHDRLTDKGLLGQVRLSCQILCDHDMTVKVISRLAGSGRKDAGTKPAPDIQPPPVWTTK